MRPIYEVWDFESRNRIGAFDSQAEALALFEKLFALNGESGVRELGLMRQEPDAFGEYEPTLLLDGAQFIATIAAHA